MDIDKPIHVKILSSTFIISENYLVVKVQQEKYGGKFL